MKILCATAFRLSFLILNHNSAFKKTPPFSSDKAVENGGSFIVKHIAAQDRKSELYILW